MLLQIRIPSVLTIIKNHIVTNDTVFGQGSWKLSQFKNWMRHWNVPNHFLEKTFAKPQENYHM